MKVLLRCLLGLLLALLVLPLPALAQREEWQELRTSRFAILYTSGEAQTAERYASFVDSIYDETAAIFGHRAATPLTLRLYPTWESYTSVNPLARNLPGIVAHADYQRHEVVVVVSQTASQTETEVQNNVRHELTHIVASDLSQDRLNVVFQEAIAQYVEHAAPELEQRVALLQRAFDQDTLLRWSDLSDRDTFYTHAQISYPQSLSIGAYLIETYSFASFRDFITTSAQSSGYRSALERTYSVSADQLERDWRAWLPTYLAGGYRRNAITAYDLSRAEQLLGEARYAEAAAELEGALDWLRTTDQRAQQRRAEALLERSAAGQRALSLAAQVRGALEQAEYRQAATLTAEAQQAYTALGDARQNVVLAEYAARAARGQQAEQQLAQAGALANALRYPQARAVADGVVAEFTALGDERNTAQARSVRAAMDQRQSLLGGLLLLFGVGGIGASLWRRIAVREAEAW